MAMKFPESLNFKLISEYPNEKVWVNDNYELIHSRYGWVLLKKDDDNYVECFELRDNEIETKVVKSSILFVTTRINYRKL